MLSQTAQYALRSMAWLAMTPGVLVPTGELARSTKVPAHYLAKVLQQMAAANLITGRRGVGGGYKLAREPGEITLRQVVGAVTPIERLTACPLGTGVTCPNLCPVHELVDSVSAAVLAILDGKTLADLRTRPGHSGPMCDVTSENGHAEGGEKKITGLSGLDGVASPATLSIGGIATKR